VIVKKKNKYNYSAVSTSIMHYSHTTDYITHQQ